MFLNSDVFFILALFSWGLYQTTSVAQQTSHYGADCTQTEPAVWLLGDERETGDGRLWACLPVPASCKYCHPPACWWEHKFQTLMCLCLGFIPCLCLEQESGEKIAVKLCRLELNSKNKDRWSREIQIMKKWVWIICSVHKVAHELKLLCTFSSCQAITSYLSLFLL